MTQDNPTDTHDNGKGSEKPSAEKSQIAAAIQSFETEFKSAREKPTQYERETHAWAVRTGKGVIIYTLLTLAIAVAAIWSSISAQHAVDLTRENFIVEERPIIWLTNNLGEPRANQKPNGKTQISWDWHYTNYGKAPANHIKMQHFISIKGAPFEYSYGQSHNGIGAPLPPGKDDFATVVSSPIDPSDIAKLTGDNDVRIAAIIVYDAFGQTFETDFCIGRLGTGAIMYQLPSDHCHNEIK